MKHLLFALVIFPMSVLADGGLPNQPYIYVEGKAEIEKPADIATLRFSLVGHNADQIKADQEVQANANKVFALLSARKVAEKDVSAGDLKSEAEYEGDETSPRKRGKFIGYAVTRTFSVKVRDIAIFPKLVDDLLAIRGAEFAGIDASLSNEKQTEDEMWKKALGDARERAEKTVKEMGMKIDSVFAVSPVVITEIEHQLLESNQKLPAATADLYKREGVTPEYRLEPVTVSQSVHVIYLISPAK